ncbi:MAG TPA: response regulator transcription factor [Candidatus Limnocylindrales bacterium]|nr:response regulator transcription factor [Candidatus Limnocylindrales bacterium]
MVRVALVDDHPLVLDGLIAGLNTITFIEVAGVGGTAEEAARFLEREDIDVLMLDVRLGKQNGLQVLAERRGSTRPHVLVLSSFNSRQYVAAATRLGAAGFLLKTTPLPILVRAIEIAAQGGTLFTPEQLATSLVALTARERDVVALTMQGMTNKEIAEHLGTSKKAVEQHLSELFAREEIQGGRVELALRAAEEGWLEINAPQTRRERPRQLGRRSRPFTS